MEMALVPIHHDSEGKPTVNARDLHEFLEVSTRFNDWISNRIKQFDFVENQDFVTLTENLVSGGKITEYHLTLDMAKELSMVERNARGKQARQYFIECEKAMALSPAEFLLQQSKILVLHERRQRQLEMEQAAIKARQIELKAAQTEASARLDRVEAMLQDDPGYFSVTGYANILKIKITDEQAKRLGKEAAALSRQLEVPISKVRHKRWGLVNAYHETVLERVIRLRAA